jgi:hypothetical protein
MVQCPFDHIIIGEKLWPCCYFLHLHLRNDFVFGGHVIILLIIGIIRAIYHLGLQNIGNMCPYFNSIDTSKRSIRNNI